MSKLWPGSMLLLIGLTLLSCQGAKQTGGDAQVETPPVERVKQSEPLTAAAPAVAESPPQVNATLNASADAQAYEAGRTAYEAGVGLEVSGQRQAALDKFRQAAERFEQAVVANPKHFKAIVNWCSALSRAGQPAQAVLKFQQALALAPDHINRAETLRNWGTALERLGKHREAVKKFEQAVALKADLLSPTLESYIYRHGLLQQDTEIGALPASSPPRQ